jgi:heavy metal sensor kinase
MVVVAPMARLNETLAGLRNLLLLIVPASVLIASIGGWYTARKALEPVSKIRTAAAAISSSNLHERVPTGTTNDELSELASTFNDMIARIEETFASQRRFVADASHDLRTPLMVIQAKLDRLLQNPNFPPHVREDLRHCASEVDRLARIANDLLLLTRAESHQLRLSHERERLDEMLIESVGKMKALAAHKNISLWVDVDEPVVLACDPPTLQRVLMNILDNAVTHTPDGGTVTARLSVEGANAVVTIADSGPGIQPDDLPKIFDRFYRGDTARSSRGSGLGLAIARTIIEAHHGAITISSTPGEGTTVRITLPI